MNDRLTAEIQRIRSDKAIPDLDEPAIKQGVILHILNILGWDTFDIEEVKPEHSVDYHSVGRRKVDYALRSNGRNKVFLEAKNPKEDLAKHVEQLLDYSFREGVRLAVLTNGLNWWFYLPLREGSWEERRFSVIELRNPDVSQTTERLISFLSMENVRSGTAVKNAESHLARLWKDKKIKEALPKAWEQLINEPDEILIELLNQKVKELSGWQPDQEKIKRFLSDVSKPAHVSPISTPPRTTNPRSTFLRPPAPRPHTLRGHNYKDKKLMAFIFEGQSHPCRSWTQMLVDLAEEMFRRHAEKFDCVRELRQRKPYFSDNPSDLRQPRRIGDSIYFVETNLNTAQRVDISDVLLAKFGYSPEDLVIETT